QAAAALRAGGSRREGEHPFGDDGDLGRFVGPAPAVALRRLAIDKRVGRAPERAAKESWIVDGERGDLELAVGLQVLDGACVGRLEVASGAKQLCEEVGRLLRVDGIEIAKDLDGAKGGVDVRVDF